MQLVNEHLIKKWEALKLEAYLPTPNDKWTIGWGHTKTARPGMKITEERAEILFDSDVAWAVDAVNKLVKVPLTQNQFDALVSFVFNIGETNFRTSTLLRKLNAKDYEGAARELPRWNKQKGKVLKGLVRRRAEEMEIFLSSDTTSKTSDVSVAVPDSVAPLKPLSQSKETVGGLGALVTGFTALFSSVGGLAPEIQGSVVTGLSVALIAFGVGFLVNRFWARYKAER